MPQPRKHRRFLSYGLVQFIKRDLKNGIKASDISKKYDVSEPIIRQIKGGRTYAEVEELPD